MFRDQVKFSFKRKMIQISSIGLAILLLFPSCARDRKPVGVLSEAEMVHVLTEIYLAEEKAGNLGILYDSTVKLFPRFEARVFEKTGVSDSVFRKSMDYYKANPKELEHIYTALVDSLNLKAQEESLSDTTKRKNAVSQ